MKVYIVMYKRRVMGDDDGGISQIFANREDAEKYVGVLSFDHKMYAFHIDEWEVQ